MQKCALLNMDPVMVSSRDWYGQSKSPWQPLTLRLRIVLENKGYKNEK